MNKLLIRLIVYFVYKIDWKKLFLVGAIILTLGSILQITFLPFPLSTWLHSPLIYISTPKSLSTSIQLSLRHGKHWPLHQIAMPVPLNASSELKKNVRTSRRKRRRRSREHELPVPIPPPPPPTPPTPLQRHIWSLSPNKQLLYAKKELMHAPVVSNDSELHAPIFKNVSIFKRSCELMELILKVYIYPDGQSPIFHEPHLSGIYASEGWFMKLMEANRQFATRNPEKAHLFYLPYSIRQLQQALYVKGSHKIAPLSLFLRDYVNSLAAKYPFWNRTHGADHFLVACHDWVCGRAMVIAS